VAGRFVSRLNGLDSLAIMKLDVLDAFERIKLCTGYRIGDQAIHSMPANLNEVNMCEPVYEEWPGWQCSTVGATQWNDLPENARKYLSRIEELLETPLALISVGPGRGQTIHVRDLPLK
jgi:adenylosuccinate synthase